MSDWVLNYYNSDLEDVELLDEEADLEDASGGYEAMSGSVDEEDFKMTMQLAETSGAFGVGFAVDAGGVPYVYIEASEEGLSIEIRDANGDVIFSESVPYAFGGSEKIEVLLGNDRTVQVYVDEELEFSDSFADSGYDWNTLLTMCYTNAAVGSGSVTFTVEDVAEIYSVVRVFPVEGGSLSDSVDGEDFKLVLQLAETSGSFGFEFGVYDEAELPLVGVWVSDEGLDVFIYDADEGQVYEGGFEYEFAGTEKVEVLFGADRTIQVFVDEELEFSDSFEDSGYDWNTLLAIWYVDIDDGEGSVTFSVSKSAEIGWAGINGGRFEELTDELNGHLEAVFSLPNTAANRTFVETDHIIQIRYGVTQKFLGVLYDVEYSRTELKCIVYNGIFELLKRRVISGEYLGLMASSVADFIRTAAGLTYMVNCPSDNVDIIFDQTLCYDAIVQLAQLLGKDYWVAYGDSLNIGDRGSAQSFDYTVARAKERVAGRSKKRDKVHVRGVDTDGNEIMGVAGTGDDVAVFWHSSPTSVDMLDAIAAAKLAEINQDDSSVVLTCPIGEGVHLDPGDTIPVVKPQLNLDGNYRIVKVVKRRKDMDIDIIRPKRNTEKVLEELTKGANNNFGLTTFLNQFEVELPPFASGITGLFKCFANPSISESVELREHDVSNGISESVEVTVT